MINGRVIWNIWDMVNEIKFIFNKEMKILIKFELKDIISNEEML